MTWADGYYAQINYAYKTRFIESEPPVLGPMMSSITAKKSDFIGKVKLGLRNGFMG